MNELAQAVLTAGLTVAGAIGVYAISRVVLDPLIEARRTIGRISFALIFSATRYSNLDAYTADELNETSTEMRRLGSELLANVRGVPWYGLLAGLRLLRTMDNCDRAAREMIGLSNSILRRDQEACDKSRRAIEELLGLVGLVSRQRP